ncbi:hypothetical protein [Xanthomonas sp. MUS 060]|uniref:hypothetical protein n=1 Tax=Xanthomonas sp. MUS 060 TaxID=1588031 RepID=UPI000AF76847|nr:hypothetical protein [Xanthomonas sp. MUS 060]
MPIQNFPAALQPIIQQNYLKREFQDALRSRLGYRQIADRESISIGIGETVTKTRAGLKPAVTTPLSPSTNTNLDNGLTPSGWGVEQYTLGINMYGDTIDLNMVTSRVGIASQFLQNAKVNGEQAARSLDELARNALCRMRRSTVSRQHAAWTNLLETRFSAITWAATLAFVPRLPVLVRPSRLMTCAASSTFSTMEF